MKVKAHRMITINEIICNIKMSSVKGIDEIFKGWATVYKIIINKDDNELKIKMRSWLKWIIKMN